MSIRERLKIAYENVVFDADNTWSKEFRCFQQTNMNLLLREKSLLEPKYVELRPRTVRDCIPNSKLAKYSNYEYNDSRELSYTLEDFRTASNYEYNFSDEKDKEPWMLEEVDTFFKLYTDFYKCLVNTNEDQNKFKYVSTFESPLMKSNSLSEYFLKLQITKDTVKRLWDTESLESMFMFRSLQSIRGEKSVLVYKSPAGRVCVSEYDDLSSELKEDYYEWCKYDINVDNDHLDLVSNTPFKRDVKETSILENQTDAVQNRRLYSAVLQGFSSSKIISPSDNQMTILRRNFSGPSENVMEKLGTINNFNKRRSCSEEASVKNQIFVANIPKLFPSITSTRSVQTASSNEVGIDSGMAYQNEKNCNQTPASQNTFFPFSQQLVRYRQSYTPPSNNYHQYPSFYMFVNNSFQQNYLQPFYNPVFVQRAPLPNSSPSDRHMVQVNCQSYVQSQYSFTSNFKSQAQFNSNIQKMDSRPLFKSKSRKKDFLQKNKIPLIRENLPAADKKTSKIYSISNLGSNSDCSIADIYKEMDELVLKTINLVLEDNNLDYVVPVTGSHSDELERQALEQYTNSSDNVFQDLERQAAEEYEDNSENYTNPPNYDLLFGGFFNKKFNIAYLKGVIFLSTGFQ